MRLFWRIEKLLQNLTKNSQKSKVKEKLVFRISLVDMKVYLQILRIQEGKLLGKESTFKVRKNNSINQLNKSFSLLGKSNLVSLQKIDR